MSNEKKEDKWLLYPADELLDGDDGLPKPEILKMLAEELGYTLVKKEKS